MDRDWDRNTRWVIAAVFVIVLGLEFLTPPAYIFGYLYIAPILLTSFHLSQRATIQLTVIASSLTFGNLWFPKIEEMAASTVANRSIAIVALIVTAWLSDRTRIFVSQTFARQQSQLRSQEQLARVREDFVSTLTHDLKTPLLGAIETIKAFHQGKFGLVSAHQQKVLEMMIRSHQTTLYLVATMLDVYRNDTEGLQLQCQTLNLVTIAEDAIAALSDLASTRQVYLFLSYGESDFRRSLWVNGDPLQLQRVFVNLLTNGINHSRRGGKVEVVMESQSDYQLVRILDTGAGITNEELPHLFKRFYQGHSDRLGKGSGLGLYLSRQIITAHGGTIWAENRSPQGAMFNFRLPAISP